MSNLYIKVRTSFFSHRKTARLRAIIGSDGFWVPLRLWAYAAENQPDGDMSGYSDSELGVLLGYTRSESGYAGNLLDALREAGFVDNDGKIHDWDEHNGYHVTYSERAKKAASARWSKSKPGDDDLPPLDDADSEQSRPPKPDNAMAEAIWAAYPKKVGKPVGMRSIAKAMTKVDPAELLEKTKAFAIVWQGGDMTLCPHPSTWFNQDRYNDDPVTWINKGTVQGQMSLGGDFNKEKKGFARDIAGDTTI